MDYDDFRIEVTPRTEPGVTNLWSVRVVDSPDPVFTGIEDLDQAVSLLPETLLKLRSPHGHPVAGLVQTAGAEVWKTLMGPNVSAAFRALRTTSKNNGKGLRVVTVLRGSEGGNGLNPVDLPIEAMFNSGSFIATAHETPLIRSFGFKAVYVPAPITGPLRILLVTACPIDLPLANIDQEAEAIEQVLAPLVESGRVLITKCKNATVDAFRQALSSAQFDIVHFVCHGSRGAGAGADSYLCLVDPSDGSSSTVGALMLSTLLKNCPLKLVIFSACSSAALPAPPEGAASAASPAPYPISAFAGIAQNLINTHEQLGAVIAMQFDFETEAAVAFSKEFYKRILLDRYSIEKAVTDARLAVMTAIHADGVKHRAWVTPVVYSRCKPGPLFTLSPDPNPAISPEDEAKLLLLHKLAAVFQESLEAMCSLVGGPGIPAYLKSLQDLNNTRGEAAALQKPAVRLEHVSSRPGAPVNINVLFTCADAVKLTFVRLVLRRQNDIVFVGARARLLAQAVADGNGSVFAKNCPVAHNGDEIELIISMFKQEVDVAAGEHVLATLSFDIPGVTKTGRHPIDILECQIQSGVHRRSIAALSSAVFVEA
jgi:hypothetical protein